MKTSVYNTKNQVVGEIDLPDQIFIVKWNPDLVHQMIMTITANRRRPVAHTKDRSEVRGGGKKPYKQKHTGRARHGSTRSPIWVGGGITFGPRKDRDFSKKINKKMARLALHSVLSKKLSDGELKVVDSLEISQPKTKELKWVPTSTLLVPAAENKMIYRASSNLPKVKSLDPRSLNVEDIAKYRNVLIDQKAIQYVK